MFDEETKKLVMRVADGNPGALTVIKELLWFTKWHEMIRCLEEINLTGSELWRTVKDEYGGDSMAFGHWLDAEYSIY